MVSGQYVHSWALLAALLSLGGRGGYAFGRFGFDIHHRFSDPVKGVLDVDDLELPEKGSAPYYAAMAHRDRAIHGRRLAGDPAAAALTFSPGNETYRLNSLGFLHYANVTVGTPSSWFLVALDTGSDLFWLPCDCSSCVTALRSSSGKDNQDQANQAQAQAGQAQAIKPIKPKFTKAQAQDVIRQFDGG